MVKKKWMSVTLAFTLSVGLISGFTPTIKVNAEDVPMFKTQIGGVFDGMPLFDGNPEHLDEFVDTYFEYTGIEGPAVYVAGARNHYTLKRGPNSGKKIPGALSAADNDQGISTDFPAYIGMGQSWNKELIADIGNVMGAEKLSQLRVKQGDSNIQDGANASHSVAFTAVSDLRMNPLIGRFDESFSEDVHLTSTLVNTMATGLSGTDQDASSDGFWMRAAVATKHFSVYNSQWFREVASNSAGARSIYEYYTRSPIKGFESGSLAGAMTSYGRTNGIPNILSPFQIHANNLSKYGVYSSTDFYSDRWAYSNPFNNGEDTQGNGYDTNYAVDSAHASVLFALAKSGDGLQDVLMLVDAVESGLYGATEADLVEAARAHVNQMVRLGIFNEVDENGIPKFYPFASGARDVSATQATYILPEHQEIALRAAQESIVLLKNDGTLPLAKNKKAAISGIYADSRFKTAKSLRSTPGITNSGDAPLTSIIKQIGGANVFHKTGGKVIALKSTFNDQMITASENETGAQLVTTTDPLNTSDSAQLFEVYDWGQEAVSLLSLKNNKWVTSPSALNAQIGNTDSTKLNLTSNDWNGELLQGNTSTIPPTLRIETNSDDTVSLVSDSFHFSFFGNFTNKYYKTGKFIITGDDGGLQTAGTTLTDAATVSEVKKDSRAKFEMVTVQDVGAATSVRAETDDYAILFVGAIPRLSSGEGNDRSSLYLGDDDYELVEKVSSAFAAKGKKTVVVVRASSPVILEEIQNNPNVSAILYQPYAGQYDAQALAQVLYGDYAPTGRLTSTWYADMSALPSISEYAIPEGNDSQTLSTTDPRYVIDMTNADPIETKLTYMYTDAPVTYEFGYGQSYSGFSYSDFSSPTTADFQKPFEVSLNVKNVGTVDTAEVVQVYAKNHASAYGEYAPAKKLVSFEKVMLAAGETKKVTLQVDPSELAIWDVNKDDLIVENGSYTLMIGASSKDIWLQKDISVTGQTLEQLNINEPFNVFDHSFASNDVIYHEVSKERTAVNLKEKKVVGGYYAVRSKESNSWIAIPKVNLTAANKVTASVASTTTGGMITLHADSPDSMPLATLGVPVTGPKSYTIANAGVLVNELGYQDVTVDLSQAAPNGNHDLYVVFHEPDLRIDSLSFDTSNSSGGGDPVITPGGSTGSNSDVEVVNNPTLNADGNVEVNLPSGKSQVQIPANANVFDGNRSLFVKGNASTVEIPSEVLKEFKSLVSATDLNGSHISLTMKAIEDSQAENLINQAAQKNQASLKAIGEVIEFVISIISNDGKEIKLTEFSKPVTITLKINGENVSNLIGVYHFAGNGNLEYAAGKLIEGALVADVVHFSKYGVLEYDKSFEDVPESYWANEVIKVLSAKHIIFGVSETNFAPLQKVTRAEFAAMIVRVLGLEAKNALSFKDVAANSWYAEAVTAANEAGIVMGRTPNEFAPNAAITREEMAVMVVRAYELQEGNKANESTKTNFVDQQDVSAWAQEYINAAVEVGLLQGRGGNRFDPKAIANRAESAQVILNLLN